ncbi:MAG: transposase [Planctomyces sp.]|nr:transposase [Planctomyces sp.]
MGQHSSADQWAAWVAEQQASELTVVEFCEWIGVSPNSFYRWRRKLAAKDRPMTSKGCPSGKPANSNFPLCSGGGVIRSGDRHVGTIGVRACGCGYRLLVDGRVFERLISIALVQCQRPDGLRCRVLPPITNNLNQYSS